MRVLICAMATLGCVSLGLAAEPELADDSKGRESGVEFVASEPLSGGPRRAHTEAKPALRRGALLFEREWKHYSAEQRTKLEEFGDPADDRFVRETYPLTTTVFGTRIGDGLGPLHNATSCAECHARGGAAGVEHNATLLAVDPRSVAVTDPNASNGRQLLEVLPGLLNELGALNIETVVHDRSAKPGYDKIRQRLISYVPGGIADSWFDPAQRTSEAIAERPVIAGRHRNVDFYLSQRNPPPPVWYGLDRQDPTETIGSVGGATGSRGARQWSGRPEVWLARPDRFGQ